MNNQSQNMQNTDHGMKHDVRSGRAALLDLLADLLLHELEAPMATVLAGDPALAEVLDPPQREAELRDLRAAYTSLFLIDVPPYASVYLDVPPVISGEASLAWERFLVARGLAPASLERSAAPDHAGLYLRALASAERDGSPELVRLVLTEALRWLPQALTAIERNDIVRNDKAGFYAKVADLAAHAVQTCALAAPREASTAVEEALPEPESEGESLHEIAQQLCTPALSGWFLSKHSLRQLARPFGVSVGIVDRDRMLEQVFEASALDERTGELLDTLMEEWQTWRASLDAWQSDLGAWQAALEPWKARLWRTEAMLRGMHGSLITSA